MTPKKLILILIAAGLFVAATSAAFGWPPYFWVHGGTTMPTGDDSIGVVLKESV
jgi:hypothetical protein